MVGLPFLVFPAFAPIGGEILRLSVVILCHLTSPVRKNKYYHIQRLTKTNFSSPLERPEKARQKSGWPMDIFCRPDK